MKSSRIASCVSPAFDHFSECKSIGRRPDLESGGCWFESSHSDQARLAKSVDATDLESVASAWRFESFIGHQRIWQYGRR